MGWPRVTLTFLANRVGVPPDDEELKEVAFRLAPRYPGLTIELEAERDAYNMDSFKVRT